MIEARRDAAFARYGTFASFEHGGARVRAFVNQRTHPIGLVGDGVLGASPEAAAQVLDEACAWLRSQGCTQAHGPISRHTWYPFRAITEGYDALPRLTGEPWNGPDLVDALERARFTPVARYVSTLTTDVARQVREDAPRLDDALARGYSFRTLASADDLRLIHDIVLGSFAPPENFLFHPIDFDEFRLVLGDDARALAPDLIRLAFAPDGAPAAFIYATPEQDDTVSIKTLAVRPAHAGRGLGRALAVLTHRACLERGTRRIVHALLREGGATTTISTSGTDTVFRRYAVYARRLS